MRSSQPVEIKPVDKNRAGKSAAVQGFRSDMMLAFYALLLQNKDGDSDDISR